MKLFLFIHLLFSLWKKFNFVAETNDLKYQAAQACKEKKYTEALNQYSKLLTEYQLKEEDLKLNIAHCYFKLGDINRSLLFYEKLTDADNPSIKSIANQQLGLLAFKNNQKKKGLIYFKQALIADANNELARYNYELLKKIVDEESKISTRNPSASTSGIVNHAHQTVKQTIQTDANSSNISSGSAQKGNQSEQGNWQDKEETSRKDLANAPHGAMNKEALTTQRRLREMNLSQEKARKLLEAMQREEVQYIQQKQKKINNLKNQPDW